MKIRILMLILISLFIGCTATAPSKIQAKRIDTDLYENWDCNKLENRMERKVNRGNVLYEKLDERARIDEMQFLVGLLLIWPMFFFIDGDGTDAEEFQNLKGECNAIRIVAREKSCNIGHIPHWANN